MKTSEIFRRARVLIDNQRYSYICYAIREVVGVCWSPAERLIMRRLYGHITYGQWLFARHPDIYARHRSSQRGGRLAWLDALIVEFEEKGD